MSNPFIHYAPLEEQSAWVGSKDALDALEEGVRDKNNICIMGVKGSGKTSLIRCFFNRDYKIHMARDCRTIICEADLSIQRDGDDVCQYLVDRIQFTLKRLLRGMPGCRELLDDIAEENASTPKARLENTIEILHEWGYFVILVMLGFEHFTSSPSVTMSHHEILRALIEANKLRCIVATNHDLTQDSLPMGVKGSYLIQKFNKDIQLCAFSEADAMQYLQQQQAQEAQKISEKVLQILIKLTGGIPLLLEYAANCTYDHLQKNGGMRNGKELTAAIYTRCRPIIKSWCDVVTPAQVEILHILSKDSSNNAYQFHDFTQSEPEIEKAVKALVKRGLLVAPETEYDAYVRINSLMLQRYCKEELATVQAQKNQEAQPSTASVPGVVVHIEKLIQGNDHSATYHQPLLVENLQINQGLSVGELMSLLTGNGLDNALDSRNLFAAQLSSRLRSCLPGNRGPLLLRTGDLSEEAFQQKYDEEFDKVSKSLLQDVAVDEEQELEVTPVQLQTLESRFSEARTRCSVELTDEQLSRQSERCQFYIKLSVIVEDALNLPGIQMDDYSPQLVLYGKALEQSLRDNFYELFHREPTLSIYNTYTRSEQPHSAEVFANRHVNQTLIGNYTYLITAKREYLANLCLTQKLQANQQLEDVQAWSRWWNQLQQDISDARTIRNMADHADDVVSPTAQTLSSMRELLFGTGTAAGVLSRSLVGKQLQEQLFPPAIPHEIMERFLGKSCRMLCRVRKTNGGIKGVTCDGGYTVNISPKRVKSYCAKMGIDSLDLVGKEWTVSILECKSQDGVDFFTAEIVCAS